MLIRGGSSKGAYFHAHQLPVDPAKRDAVLLAAVGGDARQIDGIGGAHPLTSKVGIIAPSARPGLDVDYLFAQVVVGENRVDTSPNCGNILAGVGPFALETGLVAATDPRTTLRVYLANSGAVCEQVVETPGGQVNYAGPARIDGVPGTAAPILCNYLDIAGANTGALLPTGNMVDSIQDVEVTCVDNGMPVAMLRAADLDRAGYESAAELNADDRLKTRLEALRLELGPLMRLGDVTHKVVPKMCLIAPPRAGGHVCTRTFIPHVCHESIGVLGAVSAATACILPGSVAEGVAIVPEGSTKLMSVEHPSGQLSVSLQLRGTAAAPEVVKAGVLRTARVLFRGEVLIPTSVWDGDGRSLEDAD